ncbi:CAAX amino protease [Clostridia bacterium]|nr:CAAX amino protease [Clostridia bacterium]
MEIKRATTLDEQIAKMREHGCTIGDESACREFLRNVNYYRLTAYFLPFREQNHKYSAGTSFERIKGIYELDQKLRAAIFAAVEEIEICMRSRFAYYHAHKYGSLGYLNPVNFNDRHQHERFLKQTNDELSRNQNTLFVKHHQKKYEGKFPIWAIIELFSLGMLSHFYADMPLDDRKAIAADFRTKEPYLVSWLQVLTVLRNTCAHYGRLYFMNFSKIPKFPKHLQMPPTRSLFHQILTLKLLTPNPAAWNNTFLPQLAALTEEYASHISPEHIGFADNWKDILRTASAVK